MALSIISNIFFFATLPFMLETDLFGVKRMIAVLKNDYIEYPVEIGISIPFIYRLCRHPMQCGLIGIYLFSSPQYDIGKLFFVLFNVLGIVIGVKQEEKALNQIEDYKKYRSLVTNKFLPNFLNAFDSKIINLFKKETSKNK